MRRPKMPQLLVAALCALALMLVLLGLALASLRSFEQAHREAEHTSQVEATLSRTLTLLVDAETSQRGYLLTGDADYLAPYGRAREELPRAMERIRALQVSSPPQQARLDELQREAGSKLAELTETIDLQNAGAHDRALAIVKRNRGQASMDAIRSLVAAAVAAEDALLAQRNAAALGFARLSFAGIAVAALLLVFVGAALEALARRIRRRQIAEHRVADLEKFAGQMAHDVRSPLASVGFALDMARHHPGEPKSEDAMGRAGKALERVAALVDGLLAFAVAGAPPSTGERASVKAVVSDVVEAESPSAKAREIALRLEPVPDTHVACSRGVLTSMVSNLVRNAIKYMDDSATKQVTVRGCIRRWSMTRIEVQDTGPGVPRQLRTAIFDPYVRGPGQTASGLGLGLATVKRLAEAHGGSAGVAKTGGIGSLFWFELPNAKRASSSAPAGDGLTSLVERPSR
jgi:signal transduction histidine kinase